MKFYNQQHKYYCGIDLHARKMYVCILDQKGKTMVHENIKTDPELLFELIFPYLDDIVVALNAYFAGIGFQTFALCIKFLLFSATHYI